LAFFSFACHQEETQQVSLKTPPGAVFSVLLA
jgi:hypothetical protein